MFYTYKIINKINGKIYIGKTNNIKKRWRQHVSISNNKLNLAYSMLHKAISKYGENNFSIEILASFLLERDAFAAEKFYIFTYKSNNSNIGYNLTNGGDGTSGLVMSNFTKDKIRKKAIGKKASKETRNKLKLLRLGTSLSNETKSKIGSSNRGQKRDKSFSQMLSEIHKGKMVSDLTKDKMSKSHLGKGSSLSEIDVLDIRSKFNTGNFTKKQLAI